MRNKHKAGDLVMFDGKLYTYVRIFTSLHDTCLLKDASGASRLADYSSTTKLSEKTAITNKTVVGILEKE